MKVQILLSTYNGERYLRPLLDSFIALTDVELSVLIRDDGSTDSTPDILREYESRYGFSLIFGENIGLNRSIYELARNRDISCDFFAFADQDDVWLPGKIARATSMICEASGPALYAGRSFITDAQLNVTGKTSTVRKSPSFFNAMVENVCIGHTLLLNSALMDIYAENFAEDIFVFDYWAYLIASAFGSIVFDDEPMTLYRQHGDNSIGYKDSFFSKIKMRVRRVLTGKSHYNARQLRAFLDTFGDSIPGEYRREAELFFSKSKNFFTRLSYIFKTKAYRQGRGEGIIFRLMYLFGRYKI